MELGNSDTRRVRRVALVATPSTHALEIAGPYEVFSRAAAFAQARDCASTYLVEVLSVEPGCIGPAGGLQLIPQRTCWDAVERIDTLLVISRGDSNKPPAPRLIEWLQSMALQVRRLGSICGGALMLAEAGLLNGIKATTHWALAEEFKKRYPQVLLDCDRIFTRDGNIYTSAGVTAGIDLALALVEEDYGRELAVEVARNLVLYLRRPGSQRQFSAHLELQKTDSEPLRELLGWIEDHLQEDLGVERLAKQAGMSSRNFARVFSRELGMSPGKYLQQTRLEAARRRLEESSHTLEAIAVEAGFGNVEAMHRAFGKWLDTTPGVYRQRFRSALAESA